MARKANRTKAKSKAGGPHSPSRRKTLKGIAAYMGDKAAGGVIGTAAAALGAAAVRWVLTAPPASVTMPPSTVTVTILRKITLSLEPGHYRLTGKDLVVKVVPGSNSV